MPPTTSDPKQRIQRIILDYYQSIPFEPTPPDFTEWLQTISPAERELYQWMGLDTCRSMLAFRRYCFRKWGHRLEPYLAERLSLEDFRFWLTME
ncbi:hypothetical protein [Larkinella arboricola]|uniref:hypothetical protein n=1 Tax=Larkinella arboricola TaxID=643671 RepID=UPI0011BA9165|nr:hypothetical protein [Larkinella arboricola]